jgi:dienelactone hydrolase
MRTPLLALTVISILTPRAAADPLPGTQPLTFEGDPAAAMVAGLHKYLDRETAASVEKRKRFWTLDSSSPGAYARSVQPNRERLKKIIGVVDQRPPPAMELVATTDRPALVAEANDYKVYVVRWPVLPGVDGEGLLLDPGPDAVGTLVLLPDADWTPEMLLGLEPGVPQRCQAAHENAELGYRVLIPTLINRRDDFSGSARLNKWSNQPHREFVYRMAFEMGRHVLGYEVQKVLGAVDWAVTQGSREARQRVGVIGFGEGGLVARLAAAVDGRIRSVQVIGQGGPAEGMWQEPIDRNLWGFLREFGTAELSLLIRPASMGAEPQTSRVRDGDRWVERLGPDVGWPVVDGPPTARPGRSGAAPGQLTVPTVAAVEGEVRRAFRMFPLVPEDAVGYQVALTTSPLAGKPPQFTRVHRPLPDAATRQKRQFDQLVAYTQKLWRDSEFTRNEFFWKKTDTSSPEKWQQSCDPLRAYFWEEAIGKLPPPPLPPNPRSRQVYDEPKWTGHEVMLDLYPDVFAYGILLTPKDLKPGERRPVVVCQHGLEGTPRRCIDPEEKRRVYNRFAARLTDLGYVVYCPQNPYVGENNFRQVQRKANPLKLSLFSFIIQQHATTLDWLAGLPFVDPDRIAFYGLSYGGKTAMRVPAVLPRYCLSICSGDFNEWIGKMVSVDLDRSYMFTREYEMYEFDLGNTFNYAEMAGLIAPRPFMVERGHRDGVGTDEMVAYEYAKVRRLYAQLKIPERTAIEFFDGGHEIQGRGTFAFLKKHLDWPK